MEEKPNTPSHLCSKIPDIPHNSNFEQQLKALDAAINGDESGINLVTGQEIFLAREKQAQVMDENTLKQNVRSHATS